VTHGTSALVRRWLWAAAIAAFSLPLQVGCQSPDTEPKKPLPAELRAFVFDTLPADVQHRTLIDFENKVQLVGYELAPEGVLEEGGKVSLTLYWRPLEQLRSDPEGPKWKVFTELLDTRGREVLDGRLGPASTLRRSLPPEEWRPGKIYVDQAEVTLPDPVWSDQVQLTVGFEKQWDYPLRPEMGTGGAGSEKESAAVDDREIETTRRPMRLRVVSGPSDGKGRGIIALRPTNFDPVVAKQKMAARRAAEDDAKTRKIRRGGRRTPPHARPGRAGVRSPHGALGRSSPHGTRRAPSVRGQLAPDGERRPPPGMAPRVPRDPNALPQAPHPPAPARRPAAPAQRPAAPVAPAPPPPAPAAPPVPQP